MFLLTSKGLAERSHREESKGPLTRSLETFSPALRAVSCRPSPTAGLAELMGGKAGKRPSGLGSPRGPEKRRVPGRVYTARPQSHSPRASTQSDASPARAGRTEARGEGCRLISGDPGLTALLPRLHRGPAPPRKRPGLQEAQGWGGAGGGTGWESRPPPPPGYQPGLGAPPSPAPGQHRLRQLTLPAPPLHPFPCAPGTHLGGSQLPEALKGQLGVGRPAHLVRSPGGSHDRAASAEGGEWAGGAAGATWGDRFWTLRLSGSCGRPVRSRWSA